MRRDPNQISRLNGFRKSLGTCGALNLLEYTNILIWIQV
ncbi:hypothetical protein LEP1GSC035_3845 [Leptospira noguchii str. 2007001578]|uniref:Transposase DDE domain protein n=1 Tax=Leptospira noguchii str. 2007001578 TaxID=1049974 RepID=A0ABN0IXM3_9LEPT|nr:hypothetical protein LEP1GSC035_3845 [Leptospira noguchii str. 2007001578]